MSWSVRPPEEILEHEYHSVVIGTYSHNGTIRNIAFECMTCHLVLADQDVEIPISP